MAALGIDATLDALLACVCEALVADDAPVCECSSTIGAPAIGVCCECEPGTTGELWGSLMRTYRGDRVNGADARAQSKPCAPANWVAQYQLTLARCFPTIDERGELPEASERAAAATALHADVATITRAVHCCPLPEAAYLETVTVQNDPEGGCSYLTATVRVPVSIAAAANLRD